MFLGLSMFWLPRNSLFYFLLFLSLFSFYLSSLSYSLFLSLLFIYLYLPPPLLLLNNLFVQRMHTD